MEQNAGTKTMMHHTSMEARSTGTSGTPRQSTPNPARQSGGSRWQRRPGDRLREALRDFRRGVRYPDALQHTDHVVSGVGALAGRIFHAHQLLFAEPDAGDRMVQTFIPTGARVIKIKHVIGRMPVSRVDGRVFMDQALVGLHDRGHQNIENQDVYAEIKGDAEHPSESVPITKDAPQTIRDNEPIIHNHELKENDEAASEIIEVVRIVPSCRLPEIGVLESLVVAANQTAEDLHSRRSGC
mmetsp:Transcript_9360/g.28996  ORF Transcript_9360/g.28996 Transcript_9360/m.28996 type:complete len:241 (+) Transcript_9360:191-913(+)